MALEKINKPSIDILIYEIVPVSNHDGITGSGERGSCNDNSTMMSLSFGGNRLYGYGILQYDKPHCDGQGIYSIFHGHSVWNTPEGKTRCVTDYSRSGWNDDRKEILFIPVGLSKCGHQFHPKLNNN
jgi:hypothetical protein